MLHEKATSFQTNLYQQELNHSITLGLLKHFKECHGIKKLCVLGKKSVNDNSVEKSKREVTIHHHEENYKLEQLHNVHESG